MIVLIDNFDSFTWNVFQSLALAAGSRSIRVLRNDACSVSAVRELQPSHVVLSPGPGHPATAGLSRELPLALTSTPMLGVCLGHQALAHCFGARIVRAARPRHGLTASIRHDGSRFFAGLPRVFPAALYHSLAVDPESLPSVLRATAWSAEGDIMALRHVTNPQYGIQFHPESFMTPSGSQLLTTFLAMR